MARNFSNSDQITAVPLLIQLKDVQLTETLIDELVKLQFEVMSLFEFHYFCNFQVLNLNVGWLIHFKQRCSRCNASRYSDFHWSRTIFTATRLKLPR